MNAYKTNRIVLAVVLAAALVSGLVAATRYGTPHQNPAPAAISPGRAMVVVPTGEFDNGVPVYRLPAIEVAVTRSEALARLAREEAIAAR